VTAYHPGVMSSGRVVSLQVKREHWEPLVAVDAVTLTEEGIDGDRHAGRADGKRQILLTDAADLRELELKPGDLREQVTIDLPGLMSLRAGTRLRIGDAVLELTGECRPCTHIGEHLGAEDPEELRARLEGRRGMLARVAGSGSVRVGDSVGTEQR
jgi:MOSC domain-containing protein YiiM